MSMASETPTQPLAAPPKSERRRATFVGYADGVRAQRAPSAAITGLRRRASSFGRLIWSDLHKKQAQDRMPHEDPAKRRKINLQQAHFIAHERELMNRFESLDYDTPNCEQQRKADVEQASSASCKGSSRCEPLCVLMWALHGTVGLAIGTAAFCVVRLVEALTEWKFSLVQGLLERDEVGTAFSAYLGVSCLFVLGAALLVAYVEPLAAGSGIPELKGFLNGTGFDGLLRMRTLLVKLVGVALAVSGGLIIGKEGPMVHSGAALAANLSHLPCLQRRFPHLLNTFRSDRDKRQFASCGCAAGVAAAFGAPSERDPARALERASASFISLRLSPPLPPSLSLPLSLSLSARPSLPCVALTCGCCFLWLLMGATDGYC